MTFGIASLDSRKGPSVDSASIPDYTTVTEVPGLGATSEQIARLHHRYGVGSRYSQDSRVLEVACGVGPGLGILAQGARQIIGGDFTGNLLALARNQYGRRIPVLQLDAHNLPFKEGSFDTVLLFEALYYLAHPDHFLQECRRVLSPQGVVVLCTVNMDWPDFNPSPFSTRYHSAPELFGLLSNQGFETELFGAFPVTLDSVSQKAVSLIKGAAISLHLIPRSMKGKEWLKRIFYGRLTPFPAELEGGLSELPSMAPISREYPTAAYKILYAVGRSSELR